MRPFAHFARFPKASRMALPVLLSTALHALPAAAISRGGEPPELADAQFTSGLYAHEAMYILAGGRPDTDLKFQLSIKARLAWHLFLGYTQLNHWDISKASAPFRDSTHKPSLFWYQPGGSIGDNLPLHWSAGFEHNSNGRDGASSRSLNMAFVKPTFVFGDATARHWRVTPKLYAYLSKGEENRDIADYRRNFELQVANVDDNGWGVSASGRLGRGSKGSLQFDASLPLRTLGIAVPGFLSAQVFTGYGETLLDYNRKGPTQLRVGYLLERGR